jgi:hypothetical protein
MANTTTSATLDWQDNAACAGMALDAFFPVGGGVTEAAQRACSWCPVRLPCAAYGSDQSHGVWGGEAREQPWGRFVTAAKPAVAEALQAAAQQPYRSQRTAKTTPPPPEGAPAMTAKNTPVEKPAETPAAATDEARTKSTVSKDGDHKCPSCKTTKPVTKFPTHRNAEGEYVRDTAECRECRDARRATRKAEREAAKATAA